MKTERNAVRKPSARKRTQLARFRAGHTPIIDRTPEIKNKIDTYKKDLLKQLKEQIEYLKNNQK